VVHKLHLNGQGPTGLRLTSVGVQPANPGSVDSFFDVFVEVHLDSPPDLNGPVLSLRQNATFLGPTSTQAKSWGAIKSLYAR